jgi:predicted DNA-binding transcriptional regulator AlpA
MTARTATPGTTATSSAPPPAAFRARDLAALCAISEPTLWRWHAAGLVPGPVRIAGTTRWLRTDVELWMSMGCPSRQEFEARRAVGTGR